jgi:DNA-binding NtrC family response regulator
MAKAGLRKRTGVSGPVENTESAFLSEPATQVRALSVTLLGEGRAVEMVGVSPVFVFELIKLKKVARYHQPVLITGESGVGKEQFARAVHLLGGDPRRPFVSVNCPQHYEDTVTVSELFGHAKGSFTGAVADHRGAFEEADGGVIFLDEIGDLQPGAQAMLLRALSTGEFKPLGASRARSATARVVSATNRPLNQFVMSGDFRYDLFFRLRHFQLHVPPLRERGDDWRLLLAHSLAALERQYGVAKRFSDEALALLGGYDWPGNVRQLVGTVSTGYAMADGELIQPRDFETVLDRPDDPADEVSSRYERVTDGGEDFWTVVAKPFLNRDLNRRQVRRFVKDGLAAASGSYRRLVEQLHLPVSDYQRFMDFLRHHDLKP